MQAKKSKKSDSRLVIVLKKKQFEGQISYELVTFQLTFGGHPGDTKRNRPVNPGWSPAIVATVWLFVDAAAAWQSDGISRKEVGWAPSEPGASIYPLRHKQYGWVATTFGSHARFCRIVGQTEGGANGAKCRLFLDDGELAPKDVIVKIGDSVTSALLVEEVGELCKIRDNLLDQWRSGRKRKLNDKSDSFDPSTLFEAEEQAELLLIAERSLEIPLEDIGERLGLVLGLARKLHFAILARNHLLKVVKELERLIVEEQKPQSNKKVRLRNDTARVFESFVDFARPFRSETAGIVSSLDPILNEVERILASFVYRVEIETVVGEFVAEEREQPRSKGVGASNKEPSIGMDELRRLVNSKSGVVSDIVTAERSRLRNLLKEIG